MNGISALLVLVMRKVALTIRRSSEELLRACLYFTTPTGEKAR
jgi:hypothetical protein